MSLVPVLVLAVCCHLVTVAGTNFAKPYSADDNRVGKLHPKPGVFLNCGNASTEAWLRWRPAKLRFGDTVHVDFHVIPAMDVSEGFLEVWAYVPGESDPIFYSNGQYNCQDIHMYAKFIVCPFKKGVSVDVKNYKWYLAPSTGMPTGEYYVRLKLRNMKNKELFCIFGHVILLDD